jgi:phosphoglycolate phosphatase-like HAD superfamily hydrolase
VIGAQPLAIDLDAIGDTHPLWSAWLESVRGVLAIDPASLPQDRGLASAELDAGGGGNWRTLLERFAEDHAPAYLRRDAATSTALRSLAGRGVALGVFTDAPEPLARVALAQLGATRRVAVLESGTDALDRVVATLGPDTIVVHTRNDLLSRP